MIFVYGNLFVKKLVLIDHLIEVQLPCIVSLVDQSKSLNHKCHFSFNFNHVDFLYGFDIL